jgi:hypothetical protein
MIEGGIITKIPGDGQVISRILGVIGAETGVDGHKV